MPAYLENDRIDTSSLTFSKTGIRLLRFITIVFGSAILEKIKKSQLVVLIRGKEIKYDGHFRDHRIKEHTEVILREYIPDAIIDDDFFVEGLPVIYRKDHNSRAESFPKCLPITSKEINKL